MVVTAKQDRTTIIANRRVPKSVSTRLQTWSKNLLTCSENLCVKSQSSFHLEGFITFDIFFQNQKRGKIDIKIHCRYTILQSTKLTKVQVWQNRGCGGCTPPPTFVAGPEYLSTPPPYFWWWAIICPSPYFRDVLMPLPSCGLGGGYACASEDLSKCIFKC